MQKLLHVLVAATAGLLVGFAGDSAVAIRVLSYDDQPGEGMDGRIDLERIAQVIRESGLILLRSKCDRDYAAH